MRNIPMKKLEVVIEKLDVTSLPSTFRLKKEKGKKTVADYGFTVQRVDENEVVIEAAGGVKKLAIKVLNQKSSGIYVCVAEPGENGGRAKTQSVLVVKRNDPSALLKGREWFRAFAACPVIGGSDPRHTHTGTEELRRNAVFQSHLWLWALSSRRPRGGVQARQRCAT
jgi:hypothetical protein